LQSDQLSIAYLAMRAWFGFIFPLVWLAASGSAQTIDVKTAKPSGKSPSPSAAPLTNVVSANNPAFRPVLLGKGPDALVNRIDTAALLKAGQKDGLVMFTCLVDKAGRMVETAVYRPSPNSDALQQELKRRLLDAKFTPGIYNHALVDAVYYGTVSFVVVQGKPRLRIFSNQEYPELQKESDFIGPQPIFGGESRFSGVHYPPAAAAQVPVNGVADIRLKVDDKGNLEWMGVIGEHPPLIGFGAQGLIDLDGAKFIPAFRDGKPVACEVTLPVFYPEP
jgi:hypothetical protein